MAIWGPSEDAVREMLQEIESRIAGDINDRTEQATAAINQIWTHLNDGIQPDISNLDGKIHSLKNELKDTKTAFDSRSKQVTQVVDSLREHWGRNPVLQTVDYIFSKPLQDVLTAQKEIAKIDSSITEFEQQFQEVKDRKLVLEQEIAKSAELVEDLNAKCEKELSALKGTQELKFLRTGSFSGRLRWLLTGHLPQSSEDEA